MEFNNPNQTPDELNPAQCRFSVDVLVYFECLDEYSVGWFDYITNKWNFLNNQDYSGRSFIWRNFVPGVDNNKI